MAQDVPQEVLGEIFILCLPETHSAISQPNANIPPLLLCHVCRSWRRAAMGTPQLWHELTITLEFASLRSRLCRGFLSKKVETLELWNSCRGGFLPTLHFLREKRHVFVSDKDLSKFVPFRTLFQSSAVSNALALTLSGFSQQDLVAMSRSLKDMNFKNLQFLSVTQSTGNEQLTTYLKFPTCPTLRRLHLTCYTDSSSSQSVVTFCWGTLTHLSAKLMLRRHDWHVILEQCVNLSFGSFNLILFADALDTQDKRDVVHHPNLKMLSMCGSASHLEVAVDRFIFPSLTALCISCDWLPDSLQTVHTLLSTTPVLQELRLENSIPLGRYGFLRQPEKPALEGSLSKFVPHLLTLVIDPRRHAPSEYILSTLQSSWLNDGWSHSPTQKSVEFILYGPEDREFFNSIGGKIDPSSSMQFCVSGRFAQGPKLDWQQPTAADLRHCWDDFCSVLRSC